MKETGPSDCYVNGHIAHWHTGLGFGKVVAFSQFSPEDFRRRGYLAISPGTAAWITALGKIGGRMQTGFTTRYSAVLAMDVTGYTRLMELDQPGTFARVRALMEEGVTPTIAETGGHVVKYTGDGGLVEWPTVPAAVHAALQIQARHEASEQAVRPDHRVRMRMGLNVCDLTATETDIFGEGVNLAARLESTAGVGEVYASVAVAEGAAGSCAFVGLGERCLKNVARPVRVFSAARADDDRAGSGTLPDARELHIQGFGDRPAIAVLRFKRIGGDRGHFAVGATRRPDDLRDDPFRPVVSLQIRAHR